MLKNRSIDWELKLLFLIHDASRLRRKAFDYYFRRLNITRSQWWVLATLSRGDGLSQTELADQLDLGRVAVGGVIDRLEKNGFVQRVSDKNDRRVYLIYLTPKAKPLLVHMRRANHNFNAIVLDGITEEQLTQTADSLEIMKKNLLGYFKLPSEYDPETADREGGPCRNPDDGA
ncbi:MarR family winged helix-turn-helix transcriptional regulator [Roseovarius amoyensis]|uniref:MarR family winged helix-turn-helix transcriptional regulator n=1 Tax=Roseovarius amoyensis TaxID=2211448 RepID=UPI000DBE0C31|nr:MarR family transcriptional regulator [Roseovarius amoyensis]